MASSSAKHREAYCLANRKEVSARPTARRVARRKGGRERERERAGSQWKSALLRKRGKYPSLFWKRGIPCFGGSQRVCTVFGSRFCRAAYHTHTHTHHPVLLPSGWFLGQSERLTRRSCDELRKAQHVLHDPCAVVLELGLLPVHYHRDAYCHAHSYTLLMMQRFATSDHFLGTEKKKKKKMGGFLLPFYWVFQADSRLMSVWTTSFFLFVSNE